MLIHIFTFKAIRAQHYARSNCNQEGYEKLKKELEQLTKVKREK